MARSLFETLRREAGLTLVEMTVTVALLSVVLATVLSITTSVQSGFEKQVDRSQANDQVRLAVQQMDREIRSGNLLYDPASSLSGYTPYQYLIVYTQTNATTRTPANRCVQWRVAGSQLQRRDWASSDPNSSVSSWRVVADNVVVPVGSRPFELDPNSAGRTMNITLTTSPGTSSGGSSGRDVTVKTSVTGRNTVFQYPPTICTTIPAA